MSQEFRFKQFSLIQSRTPMKVGTDGVLIGAWCQAEKAQTALDIGTGTGLIAIMLAQRFPSLTIQAIEPNEGAFSDAKNNVVNCNWANRIQLHNTSVENYIPQSKFDLIVSNPPFFHGDLKAPDQGRNMARHAEGFDFNVFLETSKWLSETGIIAGIYPLFVFEKLEPIALKFGLHLHEKCMVKPTPVKDVHRVLFAFGKQKISNSNTEELVIESDGRHKYSAEYKKLTSAFYLKF